MGPVVDVEFEDNDLPYIKDALEVDNNGKRCVMEVAQLTSAIILSAASCSRQARAYARIWRLLPRAAVSKVPVGNKTLGRLFNVLRRYTRRRRKP